MTALNTGQPVTLGGGKAPSRGEDRGLPVRTRTHLAAAIAAFLPSIALADGFLTSCNIIRTCDLNGVCVEDTSEFSIVSLDEERLFVSEGERLVEAKVSEDFLTVTWVTRNSMNIMLVGEDVVTLISTPKVGFEVTISSVACEER